jgi:hypothetical protein
MLETPPVDLHLNTGIGLTQSHSITPPPGEALRWERLITQVAQAAEELGYDASVEEIDRRAQELEKRPN